MVEVVNTSLSDLISAVTKDIKKDYDVNENPDKDFEFLSTGNIAVNYAISGRPDGGFPIGLISELAGVNSCVTGDTLVEIEVLD